MHSARCERIHGPNCEHHRAMMDAYYSTCDQQIEDAGGWRNETAPHILFRDFLSHWQRERTLESV